MTDLRSRQRAQLLDIYHSALGAVEGRSCVAAYLRQHPIPAPVYVIAIGKAAASMAAGALDCLAANVAGALVITRHGYGQEIAASYSGVRCIESGHPWPDEASLEAGRVLLDFITAAPAAVSLLFLISGGASSLVEVLPAEVSLAALRRTNQWLLSSGLPIHQMNQVRSALSCIKGGRLIQYLNGRPAWNLLISDVPGNDPAIIGSGLLVAAPRHSTDIAVPLPGWLAKLMAGVSCPASPVTAKIPLSIESVLLADSSMARLAAARSAKQLGYPAHLHPTLISGDVLEVARQLVAQLLEGAPGIHIWGGEATVCLPPAPGRGGRCQSLALSVAQSLRNQPGLVLLAAGTDGSDGPEEVAGALVDGATVTRGLRRGLEDTACLARADAGSFLAASGDLLPGGVTGTNVMDLILGLKSA